MRQLKTSIWLFLTVAVMTSCLSSNDKETTLYSDAAITSFALGTMNRYLHTTSASGADSTYKTTFTGSNYKFNIDQIGHRIYNTDSLPTGTDISHVVCTIGSKNNGMVLIESLEDKETYNYYSSADSIDFSTPRKFVVYSSDGVGYTEYSVSINVHEEEGEVFVWQQVDNATPPAPKSYDLPMDGIRQIIGNSTKETYALSTGNKLMVWRDGASAWEEDLLDEDASLLPTQDLALVCYPMDYATNTDYVLIAGQREEDDTDSEGNPVKVWREVVWRKIADNDDYAPMGQWIHVEANDSRYSLPTMENLTLLKYDDGILAIGKPYTHIYQSRDNGITWKTNSCYQMPDGFDYNATSVTATVDDDQNLWLYCAGTGQTWRGRLNRLGWK